VLDFAAGSGLVGIAAAKSGAWEVTAVDVDPFAGAAILLNAALNEVTVGALVKDLTESAGGAWDVVLAGDVCYERAMAERALPWLRALAGRGAVVLVGDPGRAYCPAKGVEEVGRWVVPTSLDLEGQQERVGRILALR
jgi:predicted nicotinamide N-methyase